MRRDFFCWCKRDFLPLSREVHEGSQRGVFTTSSWGKKEQITTAQENLGKR
ncbi:MAG: hypothetical protein ACTHK0_17930 [Ginsengibacter sp.]